MGFTETMVFMWGGGGVARERSYSTRTARSILPYSYGVRRVIQIIHKI